MHEGYDPDAVVDILDAGTLSSEDARDIDLLAVHADAAARGDQDIAIVQGIAQIG